jgi:hypothetical protein
MIVRSLDSNHDWNFGRGSYDYLAGIDAVVQDIDTRLSSFLNDCFFDLLAGIDWFNLLGTKNINGLILAIKTVILNTEGVTSLVEISHELDEQRNLTIIYSVNTVQGINIRKTKNVGALLTESGSILTTESGSELLG